jgi:hypothetical protein
MEVVYEVLSMGEVFCMNEQVLRVYGMPISRREVCGSDDVFLLCRDWKSLFRTKEVK